MPEARTPAGVQTVIRANDTYGCTAGNIEPHTVRCRAIELQRSVGFGKVVV